MEDYGVAKGYLELDVSDLESNVKSASRYLEQLERKSALAESELNKLESQSSRMGGGLPTERPKDERTVCPYGSGKAEM